jgi:hypothetical protein
MDPNLFEASYFNDQIAVAGQSIGFEDPDVAFTRAALEATFNSRCLAPATVIPPSAGPQLQSICTDVNTCPLAENANCSAYPDGGVIQYPAIANVSLLGGVPKENDTIGLSTASASGSGSSATASVSSTASGSAASPSASSTGAAAYTFGTGNPLAGLAAVAGLLFAALAL